jgi:predicted permease
VARQRELAVRAAIGASRARIVRQLLAESALLSAGGGLLGLGVAWLFVRVLPAVAPDRFPRLDQVQLDTRVLAFAMLVTLATLVLAGLVPAWRGARFDMSETLRGSDGATAGGFRGLRARRLRDGLLVAEAALAVMLLVGAGLLARSFVTLIRVDPGYVTDGVLTARVLMPRGATAARTAQFIDALLLRVRAMPGVVAAGAGNMMPMTGMTAISTFTLPEPGPSGTPTVARSVTYVVTPGYAEALGLRLRVGRFIDERDATSGVRPLVVNDEFVRRYLAAGPVVGRRFSAGLFASETNVTTEIIGVVGTVLKDGNDRQPEPEIYLAHGSHGRGIQSFVNLVVRTADAPARLAPTLRHVIRALERDATIEGIEPLADQLSASVAQPRFAAAVLAAFAGVALALASVGLYGVLSYSVSQRRRELAVRAALGASRRRLMTLVLREGLAVTAIGMALGLAAAAALTRWLQSALFGITPLDPPAFAAAAILLLVVAAMACVAPAGRAASVDPAEAFRDR